jgi:hypothetical protein
MLSIKDLDFTQYSRLDVTKHTMLEGTFEKFLIGYYKDGSQKEFGIVFYNVNDKPHVKLEAGSSAWDLLNQSKELLQELSNMTGGDIKPEDLHSLLTRLGIKDITDNLNNPQV